MIVFLFFFSFLTILSSLISNKRIISRYILIIFIVGNLLQVGIGQGRVNSNYHHVNGYVRKDGTYVNGYNRTNPNGTNRDNYSTQGNTNPWTGQAGWVVPDTKPNTNYGTSSWKSYSSPTYSSPSSSASSPTTWNENTTSNYSSPNVETETVRPNYSSSNFTNKKSVYISGVKTISYSDGKEIFSVLATNKTNFKKNLTYYFYDPDIDKVSSAKGEAFGQLLDGRYRMVYDNGNVLYEKNFKQGLFHGLYAEYDKNGNEKVNIIYNEIHSIVNESYESSHEIFNHYFDSCRFFVSRKCTGLF